MVSEQKWVCSFSKQEIDSRLEWHCEPSRWTADPAASCLRVWPDAPTDFWQRTHYGFEADNGHFLHFEAAGDFVLTTKVTTYPVHQYDQAGLMVRISPGCWLKTSVEFEPEGPSRLGAVVTNGQFSDWSTQSRSRDRDTIWLRVRAESSDYIAEWSEDGEQWEQLRMAHLHERSRAASVACGVYACSPKAAGSHADFSVIEYAPGRLT